MWGLFRGEVSRFRTWALAFAGVHAVVLLFYVRVVDLLQQPLVVYRFWGGIYALTGLLFGLFQMSGHRKPNAWLYLLHRPLKPGRIFLALFAASALLFAVAVLLPLLIALLGMDHVFHRVVDARHYLALLTVPGIVLSGYLVGCYAMLSPSRAAIAVAILPAVFLASDATGAPVLLFHVTVVAWLAFLVYRAFTPDRSTRSERPLTVLATALPLQMALYASLLFVGSIGYQFALIFLGVHPLNSTPPAGGYVEAQQAEGVKLLEAGLGTRADPEARLLREQIRITERFMIYPELNELPERGSLTNLAPAELDDEEHRVRWTFSHARMRFVGTDLVTHGPRGTLGTEDGQPFDEVPLVSTRQGTAMTRHRLYQYDEDAQAFRLRIALKDDEVFAGAPSKAGDSMVVLTTRSLLFFDARTYAREKGRVEPRLRFPMPADNVQLWRVDLAELVDSHLISLLYGRGTIDGASEAWQMLYQVDAEGQARLLNRRDLTLDYPALFRHRAVWLSPVLFAVERTIDSAFSHPLGTRHPLPLPADAKAMIALLALLSMAVTGWRVWALPMSLQRKALWVAASGAVGLPAALTFLLMNPPPERLPALAPATA